jgi:hypothetical protein
MHIHGSSMQVNAASLHATAAADKAGNAQRSADVRRKLMRSADLEGVAELNAEAGFMVGRWSEERSGQQGGNQGQSQSGGSAKSQTEKPAPGESPNPVSFWA